MWIKRASLVFMLLSPCAAAQCTSQGVSKLYQLPGLTVNETACVKDGLAGMVMGDGYIGYSNELVYSGRMSYKGTTWQKVLELERKRYAAESLSSFSKPELKMAGLDMPLPKNLKLKFKEEDPMIVDALRLYVWITENKGVVTAIHGVYIRP